MTTIPDDDIRLQQELDAHFREHQKRYTSAQQQAADIFHARQNPKLFAHLQKELSRYPALTKYHNGIFTNARLAIGFKPIKQDDYSQKGNTRFGGLPDLPPDLTWPCVDTKVWEFGVKTQGTFLYQFLAQINCADLCDMQGYLPKLGMLYFFIDTQWYIPGNHKVFYYDGDMENLQSAKSLNIKPEDIFDFPENGEIKPAKVSAFPLVSILNTYSYHADYPPMNCQFGSEADEQIEALNQDLAGDCCLQTLHGINANVFTQCGSPQMDAAKALGGKPEDYMVLLCIKSDQDISGFCFGDAGDIYFVIAKERLKNKDFSQVYCSIETS